MEWRNKCDWEGWSSEDGDTCGWVYWDDWNLEEFFVTCDEWNDEWTWCSEGTDDWTEDDWDWDVEEWCDNEWHWEECSWMSWRNACDWEGWSDENGDTCGYVYWDDWSYSEYWVSCDDWSSWETC